jgi:hypothetical protein
VAIVTILTIGAVVSATSMSPTIHGVTNATGCCRALVAPIRATAVVVVARAIVAMTPLR